jgi:hypothetical protein
LIRRIPALQSVRKELKDGLVSKHLRFLLQYFSRWGRHDSSLLRGILALEIIRHLFECDPLNALMLIDVINDPAE